MKVGSYAPGLVSETQRDLVDYLFSLEWALVESCGKAAISWVSLCSRQDDFTDRSAQPILPGYKQQQIP